MAIFVQISIRSSMSFDVLCEFTIHSESLWNVNPGEIICYVHSIRFWTILNSWLVEILNCYVSISEYGVSIIILLMSSLFQFIFSVYHVFSGFLRVELVRMHFHFTRFCVKIQLVAQFFSLSVCPFVSLWLVGFLLYRMAIHLD